MSVVDVPEAVVRLGVISPRTVVFVGLPSIPRITLHRAPLQCIHPSVVDPEVCSLLGRRVHPEQGAVTVRIPIVLPSLVHFHKSALWFGTQAKVTWSHGVKTQAPAKEMGLLHVVCLVFKILLDVSRKMFYDGISRSGSSLGHHRLILNKSRITRTYQNLPELTRTYQNLPESQN